MPPIYTTSNSCSTLVDANDNDDLLGKSSSLLVSSPYAPLVLGSSATHAHAHAHTHTLTDQQQQEEDYLLNTCLQLPSVEDEAEHDVTCCFYDENQIHKSLSEYDLSEYYDTDDTTTTAADTTDTTTDSSTASSTSVVEYLRLPAPSSNISTDQYLSNHPEHYAYAQRRLQQASHNNNTTTSYDDDNDSLPSITVSSNESRSDYSIKPLIYIHQREVGYVSSLQYNQNGALLCSDSATTCHLLALRSTSVQVEDSSTTTKTPPLALGSLSHLDSIGQEDCIRKMITTHVQFHSQNNTNNNGNSNSHKPIIEIHMAGGFNDERGHSAETTDYLLNLLSDLSFEYKDRITMKLSTCIVSTLNDTKHMGMMTTSSTTMEQEDKSRHVVGGMSLDVNTGKVTLLHSIDEELRGPDSTLRHVRLWSSSPSQVKNVSIVHTYIVEGITIEPFEFESFPDMDIFENLPDELILEYTSTSPHCEPNDFCIVTRNVCRFIREQNVMDVFGGMGKDIVHLWEGNNCWEKRV